MDLVTFTEEILNRKLHFWAVFIASLYLPTNCGLFANFLSKENNPDKAVFLLPVSTTSSLSHKSPMVYLQGGYSSFLTYLCFYGGNLASSNQ